MVKTIKKIMEEEYGTDIEEYKKDFICLIIEAEDIVEISEEDKTYLENFADMRRLILSQCKLKSLKNMPKLDKLERVEFNDNNITGGLEVLSQYPNLKVVKFAGNKIKEFDEIKKLAAMENIDNVDFLENPVAKDKDYSKTMWEIFPKLKSLDGCDKEGEELLSEMGEGEEGEFDFDGEGEDFGDFIDPALLDEATLKQLEAQGFIMEDDVEGDFEDAEGEDDEGEGVEKGDSKPEGGKRSREDADKTGDDNKRQKTEE